MKDDDEYTHPYIQTNGQMYFLFIAVLFVPSTTLLKPLSKKKKALSTTADPKMNSFCGKLSPVVFDNISLPFHNLKSLIPNFPHI